MLEMTDSGASIDLSEEAKQAKQVLSKAVNSVCYIYVTDFRDLEELHKIVTGEELAKLMGFLLCSPPCYARR